MRPLPEPARDSLTLAPVLHALGDPVRLELMRRASGRPEASCSALADGLGVPMSTLSNHFRILREAGLISMTVDGRHRRIRLRTADMGERFPGLLDPILRLATPPEPESESERDSESERADGDPLLPAGSAAGSAAAAGSPG